jgi:decaprenylphospho-beta-D-ribofuranose 2-oxidase
VLHKKLTNWGNFPAHDTQLLSPQSSDAMRSIVQNTPQLIARGNGRSYGDASLGDVAVSTLQLNKIIHFDAEKGTIECQSGVLLRDILQIIIPKGWFLAVTPGTKFITIGGAIASDVHGKNHPNAGCFSQHLIGFDLMLSDGEIVHCTKSKNADFFWQTCGGMGWTGVILSASFQLKKIKSTKVIQKTTQKEDFEGLFNSFEAEQNSEHCAAWIDGFITGRYLGRGILYAADHAENTSKQLVFKEKKGLNIPTFFPSFLLNNLTMPLQNEIIYQKNGTDTDQIELDEYFYPLDGLKNWNRLYGSHGFIQYQFCLPTKNAFDGIKNAFELLHKERIYPYLAVMKRHGNRPKEAINSFPIEGYSLALDFPVKYKTFEMARKLDDLVWKNNGKIYLAKDACSASKMSRINPNTFGDPKFESIQKKRIK